MKALGKTCLAIFIAFAFASCGSNKKTATNKPAQTIERLSQIEIDSCDTPRAVAYNFVMSIVNEEYSQTVKLMSLEYFYQMMQPLFFEGIPINQLFSTAYTHKIVDMRPVVKMGYDVVVTNSCAIDTDNESDKYRYKGQPAYYVSFNCANNKNKFYNGSKGKYDTAVTVTVVEEDGKWKVLGFE